MSHRSYYKSPIGTLCIEEEEGFIVGLYFVKEATNNKTDENEAADNEGKEKAAVKIEVLREAKRQLEEYFAGERTEFDLPIKLKGTDFQVRVWEELRAIPYGEARSYGEVAKRIGNPKAARAVGNANNKNHILILVPCHRVIGTDGSLVGFGAGLDVKKYLLELEGKKKRIEWEGEAL